VGHFLTGDDSSRPHPVLWAVSQSHYTISNNNSNTGSTSLHVWSQTESLTHCIRVQSGLIFVSSHHPGSLDKNPIGFFNWLLDYCRK